MRTGLSYDDVALVPKFNNIESRTEPLLKTKLTTGVEMSIPIINANMETVIGPELTRVLEDYGSVPIQHRFWKDTQQLADILTETPDSFVSWGVGPVDDLEEFINTYKVTPLGVCVDIAQGHAKAVLNTIEQLRKRGWDEVIAGNICTSAAYVDLVNAGATGVKIGIGPGEVCRTRNVTASGVPQFTAIQDCSEEADRLNVPLIADGGIKSSREIILALAAGASSVMIGGLFARTKEAAGKGVYRGQASKEFQEDYYGEMKAGTVAEGIEIKCEITGTASELIDELIGGIKSGMTYNGARSVDELQRKAEFIRITDNYF